MAQSSGQAPFTSEIVGSILATDSCEKSQSMHSAESRGFSPGAPVSHAQGKLVMAQNKDQ